jgi:hypothetical protein
MNTSMRKGDSTIASNDTLYSNTYSLLSSNSFAPIFFTIIYNCMSGQQRPVFATNFYSSSSGTANNPFLSPYQAIYQDALADCRRETERKFKYMISESRTNRRITQSIEESVEGLFEWPEEE